MDVCARCAGGNNAGHTIVVPMGPDKAEKQFSFHLLPSGASFCLVYVQSYLIFFKGLVNPSCIGLIGSGCVVHIPSFFEELDALQAQGTIKPPI